MLQALLMRAQEEARGSLLFSGGMLAEFCPRIMWKAEFISHEFGYISLPEIFKQNIEYVA